MKGFIKCLLMVLLLAGCSQPKEEVKSMNIKEYAVSVEENYYDTFMTDMNESDFYTMFTLDPEQTKQMVYKEAFLDVKADALVMIEVNDETLVSGVVEVLEKRMAEIQAEFETYIPEVYEIASKGQIIVHGNYIFMIINENVDVIVHEINSNFE